MHLPASVPLCDAIEIGSLQLGMPLSPENVLAEVFANSKNEGDRNLVFDAFAVATLRAEASPEGYPFNASARTLSPKVIGRAFSPYLFLLLGVSAAQRGMLSDQSLARRFRREFEDFVCWVLRRCGFLAEVLSEPRSHRGLDKSLRPALLQIAERFGENAFLDETKFAPHDSDLDVDVVATPVVGDRTIGGWPTLLVQCATGPVQELNNKILEVSNTFCSVWGRGFNRTATLKGGATADELLQLEPVFWGRLHDTGFVLHRMRLVNLAIRRPQRARHTRARTLPIRARQLERDLRAQIPEFSWRTGWQ
jgi:hypothetical protein